LVELGGVAFVLADEEFAPGEVEGVGVKVEGVIEEEFEVVKEMGSGCILGENFSNEGGEIGGGLHGAPVFAVGCAGVEEGAFFGGV
jgi:hypothetical protein